MADINVQVAYALPRQQWVLKLAVPEGTTVAQAIELSGISWRVPMVELEGASFGVFGNVVPPTTVLREGDRVEIYRPLVADAKQVRRERAAKSAPRKRGT